MLFIFNSNILLVWGTPADVAKMISSSYNEHMYVANIYVMKGQDGHPFIMSKRETDDWGGAPPFLETSV